MCNDQGRLIIFKDINSTSLYLHCEECEWGWRNPDSVHDKKAAFLTLKEDIESEIPSLDEIEKLGWGAYALHWFDEDD